jgi:hypothetical protein
MTLTISGSRGSVSEKETPPPMSRYLSNVKILLSQNMVTLPYRDSNSDPSAVQPVASRYSGYAIPAPLGVPVKKQLPKGNVSLKKHITTKGDN